MKKLLSVFGVFALVMGAVAVSADTKIPEDVGDPAGAEICNLEGYKSYVVTLPTPVPLLDNNSVGVVIGPIATPADGSNILDLIVDLDMTHSWIGDLIVEVLWDTSTPCDGTIDLSGPRLLCRQNRTSVSCETSTSGFGCSGDLVRGGYVFSDAAAAQAGEPSCPTTVVAGCYKPANGGTETYPALSFFDGRPKTGCWYLKLRDRAGGDTGTIYGWSVHILNSPTATENSSWGAVKALYQ